LAEIICDTSVMLGYIIEAEDIHPFCERFFQSFPIDDTSNSFFYTRKIREEFKYKMKTIGRNDKDSYHREVLIQNFIDAFFTESRELDYENSQYPWQSMYWNVRRKIADFQEVAEEDVSNDANNITHYICFCLDKKNCPCSDHFFVTGDTRLYDCRKMLRDYVTDVYKDEIPLGTKSIPLNLVNVWNFR
jgi:hypothetical protein